MDRRIGYETGDFGVWVLRPKVLRLMVLLLVVREKFLEGESGVHIDRRRGGK